MKFSFKQELETTDLVKSLVTIIGAILAFYLITSIQLKNDNIRLKLELTKLIPKLQPHVQSNFSNQVNPNNSSSIDIKLYLKILSDYYIYYFPPKIQLVKKGTDNELYKGDYQVIGLNSYRGLFSPKTTYNINYQIIVDDPQIDYSNYDILLEFAIDTDKSIQDAYGEILSVFGDDAKSEVDRLSYKIHKFRDQIYLVNKNFEPFFEQCSVR